jgi:Protein of unknown function (DUF3703)
MSTFTSRIRPLVRAELDVARISERQGAPRSAFRRLERAHVLSQASVTEHLRVHVHMLGFALRQRRLREAVGQLFRLALAGPGSALGRAPRGNTGGSDVGAFQPMAIPADLQALIDAATAERPTATGLPSASASAA